MISSVTKFPLFDRLELDSEPEIRFTQPEKLSPLEAGTPVYGLKPIRIGGKWHPFFDEIVLDTTADSLNFTPKPLLLYFYEKEWGPVTQDHLSQLNAVRNELRRLNVNLLVVTSGSLEQFHSLSWKEAWSLDAFEDQFKELAGILNIYAENSPSWSRYAGLEKNVPLPALYLLDHARRVGLAFPNESLQAKLPLEEVMQALLYTGKYWPERKSA
jgi:peroxiredoxin